MRKRRRLVALLAVLMLVAGFGTVRAFSPQPGSADDPLVTVGYLNQVIQSLQSRISSLESTNQALEQRIVQLENRPSNPAPAPVYGHINGTWVNVRAGKGTNFPILVVLPMNIRVEVLERGGEWHKIKHNNTIGYVHGPLLRIP